MANVDLQQIRTVRPAVLPLDTKQTLFELQQENLLPGAKSTAATLEEIQSSPATAAVVASATHTTGLETEIHVTAATCAITADAATWPIGATKKIWKLSAYDGNAVTITPPSGATIEGLASIELYGQYSFVELERISETVFAVKDWRDSYALTFAPSFTSGSTWTLSTNQGLFSRDKRRATISGRIVFSSLGDAGGYLNYISPFPAITPVAAITQSCCFQVRDIAENVIENGGHMNVGSRNFAPAKLSVGGKPSAYAVSNLTASTGFYFNFTYFV